MVINGSGIRDTARVLNKACFDSNVRTKKKEALIEQVNYKWLEERSNQDLKVVLEKAEVDEMESYVGQKKYQRWLWHAIDHKTGTILAFVLGRRQDRMFLKLKKLLKPFGVTKFYTDKLKTYSPYSRIASW